MADVYVIDDAGVTIADWLTLQTDVCAAYQADPEDGGFGPQADVTPDSPFYKIASPVTRQTAAVLQAVRDLSAQLDPQFAFGLQLDRLGSLIGLRRRGATRSTIEGRVVGTPGTLLVAGALLRYLPTGSRWQLAADATIGPAGTVAVELFALDFGPVDAPQAGSADWQIVTGQVLGWDSFESTDAAQLGALRETDVEYRARFLDAATGLCTYDAIVNRLREVPNVSAVYLYVNKALTYDNTLQLEGKQMRAIVQGGLKSAIIAALHATLGAPVDTAGAVVGEVDPGNGQILEYRYDRLRRRRCYLKLTITGGNPAAPLPADAADLASEAVEAVSSPVGPFIPMVYGLAAVQAILAAVPGSVTKLVAEGRLDPADPWVEDAIALGIAEQPDVSTVPTPAVADADATAFTIPATELFFAGIDGGASIDVTFNTKIVNDPAAVAAVLNTPVTGLVGTTSTVVDGRLRVSTDSVGGTSSIQLDGGVAVAVLYDDPFRLYTGSDNDATIVIVP